MILRSSSYITVPVVACGIIVYNQKGYIAQCIEGMLQQQCDFPFNIVVADDCSTDGTQDILRTYQAQYPDKIKLVLNEKNGGIAANWVSCCRAMEGGEFVSFCDGDDYWSNPEKLQLQVNYLRQHHECVAVSTDYDVLCDDGELKCSCRRNNPPLTGMVQDDLWSQGKSMGHWSSMMFRKDIFDEKVDLCAFVKHDFPFQDWPTLVIMSGYGEFQFISVPTSVYRIVKGSDSHAIDIDKLIRRQERCRSMNKYLASLFPNLEIDTDEVFDRYIASTIIGTCIKNNDYDKAREYARKSGHKNFRYWCCQTKLTFHFYRFLKLLKQNKNNKH